MKKKIVHLISSLKMGGAESLLYDFLASADKETYEVAVLYFHEGPNVARLQQLNVPLYHIKGAWCLYDPLFFWRLFWCIKRLKPSLLHTWLWSANIAGRLVGKLLGIPVINSFHNNVDQDGTIRQTLDRSSWWMATELVAVSDGIAGSLKVYKISPEKLTTIKNGIQADVIQERGLKAGKTRAMFGLTDDHYVIGSVGRFVPEKNYTLLLESFALLAYEYTQVRLLLVGGGPEEKLLRALASTLNIADKVTFVIGQQSYGFYPLFDCFALSSPKEGISMALLEAMSFSLPCVSTHQTKIHDVIDHERNGLLVPAGDAIALKKALETLIIDEEKGVLLGKNAYARVKNDLSFDLMKNRYEALYMKSIKY